MRDYISRMLNRDSGDSREKYVLLCVLLFKVKYLSVSGLCLRSRCMIRIDPAHLERRPIVTMPHKCKTVEEWIAQTAICSRQQRL